MTALSLSPSPYETSYIARATQSVPYRHTDAGMDSGTETFAGALTLELVEDRATFDTLEAEWNDLFHRAGRSEQLFQSFGWLWHWANHFLTPDDRKMALAVVAGRRNGILVLALPFVVTRGKALTSLSFMGDPVSQYGDVLIDPRATTLQDLRVAFDFVLSKSGVDVLHLRKVRSDAALAPLLRERGAEFTDVQQAPYIAFEDQTDFTIFEQRYPKSARKNRKRQLRRLQETGTISFERLPAGDEASEAASLALSLKREWLRQRGLVSPAVADARTEAFFRDCASGDGPATGVEIGFVRSDGQVAAIEIAIQCKDRVAVHLISYDARFEKTGAGSLLMEDRIRRACEMGMSTLDLLAPGTAYKFEWADRAADIGNCSIGLSAAGKLYTSIYLARLRPTAKLIVEGLPMALRRYIAAFVGAGMVFAEKSGVT